MSKPNVPKKVILPAIKTPSIRVRQPIPKKRTVLLPPVRQVGSRPSNPGVPRGYRRWSILSRQGQKVHVGF